MLSFQLPTVSPLSRRLTTLPKSNYKNENHFSSLKLCSRAGKRTGGGPNLECFSPASPIPKFRLAAASVSTADGGTNDEKTVIQLAEELRPELMPKHVAVIMDGNGRWAMNRGLSVQHGHKVGPGNLKYLASNCCKLGIKVLTVYVFSTENWNRSKVEVDFLMRSYEEVIQSDVKELIARDNMRFSVIGNASRLPESLRAAIASAEEESQANKGMHFILAMSYSGRDEIIEATKNIANKVEHGILRAKNVDEALFEQELMTNLITQFPCPDLLIRTSGELRVSNFFLWQLAYTEFYFANKMFPDFGEDDLVEALASFQRRQRRYGKRNNYDGTDLNE